jgi:pyrimidine operon attenuation protein/uracil phosphoribosyltransferase
MSSTNERQTPSRDLAFLAKSQLLTSDEIERALARMAHEIVERNDRLELVSVVGLQTGGVAFAERITALLSAIGGAEIVPASLDVSFYRDDVGRNPMPKSATTTIDQDLTERTVVLVDDVLFTGRTIRAALNALSDWGRPRSVQLAVLIDRGHRELPIRADFVGKNLPTSRDEAILATLEGVWIGAKGRS